MMPRAPKGAAEGWRRKKRFLWGLAALVLLVGAALAARNTGTATAGAFLRHPLGFLPIWAFHTLEVEGNSYTPFEDVAAALGIKEGTGLYDLDLDGLQKKLRDLKWVEKASLFRRPPHTLRVRLQEYVPVALWRQKDRWRLVDQHLQPLDVDAGDIRLLRGLLILAGDQTLDRFGDIRPLLQAYPRIGVYVRSVVFLRGHLWILTTTTDTRILISPLAMEEAFRLLDRIQDNYNVLGGGVAEIDLRLGGRFFMTPRQTPARIRYRQRMLRAINAAP